MAAGLLPDPPPDETRSAAGLLAKWRLPLVLSVMAACYLAALVWSEPLKAAIDGWLAVPGTAIALAGAFALVFFLSQLVAIPSGTVLLILSGTLLGWWMGIVFHIAMLAAAVPVFLVARSHPQQALGLAERWLPERFWHAHARGLLAGCQHHAALTTMALRLLPVVPSAGCSLVVAAMGGRFAGFMTGTLLAGWVRPVAFATLGQLAGGFVLGQERFSAGMAAGFAAVSLGSLLLSGVAGGLIFRRVYSDQATKGPLR